MSDEELRARRIGIEPDLVIARERLRIVKLRFREGYARIMDDLDRNRKDWHR